MHFKLLLTFTLGVFATSPSQPPSSELTKSITIADNNGTSHTLTSRDWDSNYASLQARAKLESRFKTGGFLDKCKNVRYYLAKPDEKNHKKNAYNFGYKRSPWLVAECPDKKGNFICTWLELGKCLVNLDGELYQGKNGNFQDSCTQCNLRKGRWFNCGCWTEPPKGKIDREDIDERLKRTSIDLDVAIAAQDGYLYCHGNWGIKDFCSGRPSSDPFSASCADRNQGKAYCWQ
ncbi:hypothetical protein NW768_005583 [Fusarium equiseti]|uniref:Cyanovirin-N domain-containing protein n=1 Tax=Fusarium equiseti TaxID=61235 RepID=A0ABQ8RCD4_FUSEQ|nr:hypothetical protein NW768_005583 [Fusarium equiseti]